MGQDGLAIWPVLAPRSSLELGPALPIGILCVTSYGSTIRTFRVAGSHLFGFSTCRGRSLDIVALGQQAIEQLLAKGHLIATAVSQEFGTPPCDRREFGMCSIDLGRTPTRYNIPRMIVQKYQ